MSLDPDDLEVLRGQGDARADAVMADLFETHSLDAVNALLRRLLDVDDLPPDALPAPLRAYFEDTLNEAHVPREVRHQAEGLFARLGPEIVLGLGAFSLPMGYAVGRAAPVLLRTAHMVDGTRRRVLETTQFVVDCFGPGGLGPHGRGFRSAQKVRLMHAAVRRLLLSEPGAPWDRWLGLPINQVDMVYTLHTFDGVVLDGLALLRAEVDAAEADAWHTCWRALGRVLGVAPGFLPMSRADADTQGALLSVLLHEPSEAGRALTAALIEMFQDMIPGERLDGHTPDILRHYLPPEVAEMLGVPASPRPSAETMTRAELRRFSLAFIDALLATARGPRRTPFAIPSSLARSWRGT